MFFNTFKLIFLEHALAYPTPSNLSYAWSFGFLSGICIALQVLTGFFLATQYVAATDLAFSAIMRIMQDVPNGWFLRLMHANGSSFLFFCLYTHIFRGLFFKSYLFPQTYVWFSGILIYLCATATAFFGYVLPWGQMSFWAATVITNLITVIPFAGSAIAQWFWGGYTIGVPTLLRFFSIHYLLPFIILALIF
jgi:ubiquinol-cytochrome c reductase cytochrome b subunit